MEMIDQDVVHTPVSRRTKYSRSPVSQKRFPGDAGRNSNRSHDDRGVDELCDGPHITPATEASHLGEFGGGGGRGGQ